MLLFATGGSALPGQMQCLTWSVAVPYLVSCSKQHIIGAHESGKLVSAGWLQVVLMRQGVLLQLDKLRKKACQYLLAQLELRAGYVNLILRAWQAKLVKLIWCSMRLNRKLVAEGLVSKPKQTQYAITHQHPSITNRSRAGSAAHLNTKPI